MKEKFPQIKDIKEKLTILFHQEKIEKIKDLERFLENKTDETDRITYELIQEWLNQKKSKKKRK
jgi:hypothetical protein